MTTKVLLVASGTSTTAGSERHVADIAPRLQAAGFEVELLSPPGGDLAVLAHDLGVNAYHAEIESGIARKGLADARRAIASSAPGIVHAHGSRAAFYARLGDPESRERCVYSVHGIHLDKSDSLLRRSTLLNGERALVGSTAAFVTVCRADLEHGDRLGILNPARTTVVYNGVELPDAGETGVFRRELGIGSDVPLVLSIGRFHRQKDQRVLLEAWARVIAMRPDAVLALVGSGPAEGDLRARAVAFGLGGTLRLVTPRAEVDVLYRDADVFVLSSLWEGLPYTVLEAMSYGLPVVATNVDGVPEAIDDPATGRLVPPGEAVALADALLGIIGMSAAERASMGERGRMRVAGEFSMARMIEGLTRVYEGVR